MSSDPEGSSADSQEVTTDETNARETDEDAKSSLEETLSPAKKKLDSVVLGDGSFETLMKERSRVR